MNQILADIVRQRETLVKQHGFDYGEDIPKKRQHPIVLPRFDQNLIIFEIKRSSPSQGEMNPIMNPAEMAKTYVKNGANAISVLTDKQFFKGTLKDLIRIKSQLPTIPVLRKDFLLYPEDINVSYRVGADMVLLIASLFTNAPDGKRRLIKMYNRSKAFGMLPLLELHDERDYEFVRPLKGELLGINSRDLETFKINRTKPHALRHLINGAHVIFESGINGFNDAFFAGISDFSGVLVGSAVVKSNHPEKKMKAISEGFTLGKRFKSNFYRKLFQQIHLEKTPLIKVCGITNRDDLQNITDNGGHIVGFILAKSPRQISLLQLQQLSQQVPQHMLKVGVVTPDCIKSGIQAVETGIVDALQIHGLTPLTFKRHDFPINTCWYQANQVSNKADIQTPLTPFVLYDAFEKGKYGGTGKRIANDLVKQIKKHHNIFGLAGGITPENVTEIIDEFKPSMIDICSGLEKAPGKKDYNKTRRFFNEIKGVSKDTPGNLRLKFHRKGEI